MVGVLVSSGFPVTKLPKSRDRSSRELGFAITDALIPVAFAVEFLVPIEVLLFESASLGTLGAGDGLAEVAGFLGGGLEAEAPGLASLEASSFGLEDLMRTLLL